MFSGLQSLVKQKKQSGATPPTTTTTASGGGALAPSATSAQTTASDPYAAARDAAEAKRLAASAAPQAVSQPATEGVSATATTVAGVKRARSPSPDEMAHPSAPTKEPSRVQMTETEFDAQNKDALAAIALALAEARAVVQKEMTALKGTSPKSHTSPLLLTLPPKLRHFLEDAYIMEASDNSATPATAWPEATELQLLTHLHAAPSTESTTGAAVVTPAAAEVRASVHVLWYRLLLHWQASLKGTVVRSGDEVGAVSTVAGHADGAETEGQLRGWCYPAYQLSINALPDELKYSKGTVIAQALADWQSAKSARWHYLRLVAVLTADYETLQAAGATAAGSGDSRGTTVPGAAEAQCYLPQALRHHLYELLVIHLTRDMNPRQAQQAYAEMAMGNANWKLGLFSAGEVHMRRSMEKVERNRIAHLLNNEPAMQMLRSMKEIVFSSSSTVA